MEKVVSVKDMLSGFSSGFECEWKVMLTNGKTYTAKGTLTCHREVYALLRQNGIQPQQVARVDAM